jgi:uncharacterized membrane protein YfcA
MSGAWATIGVESLTFFFAFLSTGLTSFGSAVIVHMGFAVAASAGLAGFDSIPRTVASLVLVALLFLPMQAYLLRKSVNWPVVACLAPSMLIASVAGVQVVTRYGDDNRFVRPACVFFFFFFFLILRALFFC